MSVNLFHSLPSELLPKIGEYEVKGVKIKESFALVDHRTHQAFLDAARCIRISPPFCFSHESHPSDIPEDILVHVIRRYRNLKKMTFGPPKNWNGSNFTSKEAPYLQALISYLESHPDKHPLSSVKKIICREITYNIAEDFTGEKAKALNKQFLCALSHPDLEKVSVKAHHAGSVLTGDEIQPVLTRSSHLKTFVFDGFQSSQTVSLSFANQSRLSKVKLLHWRGTASTIESLKECKDLEELVIDYEGHSPREIIAAFLKKHPWNLKHLHLNQVPLQSDQELATMLQQFPKLESLSIKFEHISDEGMEQLGRNCRHLKALQLTNENLTNSGLARLTQHLPHLKTIHLTRAYTITEEGLTALAQNCKDLRLVNMINYKRIGQSGIHALIENCPALKGVEFSFGGPLSFEAMEQLVEQCPQVRYVSLFSINGMRSESRIEDFYKKFSHVSKIPFTSSAKKLLHVAKSGL